MNEASKRLIEKLTAGDVAARRTAAEQLAQLGPDAAPVAVALVQASGDADESVRQWAVAALEGLESPPPDKVLRLSELLGDSTPDVAYWAATLLGRLADRAAPAVSSLAAVLERGGDLAVRERAASALGEIGPSAAAARPALEQAAAGGEPRLQRLAAKALERL